MTDSWTEERAEFIKEIVPGILRDYPEMNEIQLVAILGLVVTGMDEMWRQTVRELAAKLPAIAASNPALLPGLRMAAKTITAFVESP